MDDHAGVTADIDALAPVLTRHGALRRALNDFVDAHDETGSAIRLSRAFIDAKVAVPDALHMAILRRLLRNEPERMDLTRSVVALMLKRGSPPLPPDDWPKAAHAADLDDLIRRAAEADAALDVPLMFAALWQAIVQHPNSARGWAGLALAFAERRDWSNAREALRRVFRARDPSTLALAPALAALNILAEQNATAELDWRDWFSSLPDAAGEDPNGVALMVYGRVKDPSAALPKLALTPMPPKLRVKAAFVAAVAHYDAGRFTDAEASVRQAFEADFPEALWQMVSNYGIQVDTILRATGNADAFGAWLTTFPDDLAGALLVPPSPAREVVAQTRMLRREALEKGLPSPLLVTQAKSGSVSVGNIFSTGFRLPTVVYSLMTVRVIPRWLDEYARGGCCYVTHLEAFDASVAALAAKVPWVIVHVRDPRQLLISQLEHFRKYPGQASQAIREAIAQSDDVALDFAVKEFFPGIVAWIDGWIDASSKLKVHFTTFESFVQDRDSFIERLLGIYGADPRHFDRTSAVTEQSGVDYHRRSGRIDEWRERLSSRQIDRINASVPDRFWTTFGWSA